MHAALRRPIASSSTAAFRTLRLSRNTTPIRVRFMTTSQFEFILTSRPADGVGLITLNRPKALNALCSPLFKELNQALKEFDEDDEVGAMVITGSDRAFAGVCGGTAIPIMRVLTAM